MRANYTTKIQVMPCVILKFSKSCLAKKNSPKAKLNAPFPPFHSSAPHINAWLDPSNGQPQSQTPTPSHTQVHQNPGFRLGSFNPPFSGHMYSHSLSSLVPQKGVPKSQALWYLWKNFLLPSWAFWIVKSYSHRLYRRRREGPTITKYIIARLVMRTALTGFI